MSMLDDELARLTGKRTVRITPEEGMLLDWVLTMHSFDEAINIWLLDTMQRSWREQAGKAVINPSGGMLHVSPEELEQLLVLVPITFRFGTKDAGYSLKCKLFTALYGPQQQPESAPVPGSEEAPPNDATNQNQTSYSPSDSTEPHP